MGPLDSVSRLPALWCYCSGLFAVTSLQFGAAGIAVVPSACVFSFWLESKRCFPKSNREKLAALVESFDPVSSLLLDADQNLISPATVTRTHRLRGRYSYAELPPGAKQKLFVRLSPHQRAEPPRSFGRLPPVAFMSAETPSLPLVLSCQELRLDTGPERDFYDGM